jgi:hypothetical protein
MGKAGRKRKSGAREPNGRVQRVAEDANLDQFKERMRRYHLSERDARDQRSSTVIGRLLLQHIASGSKIEVGITEAEYEAGARFAADSTAYARCLQSPRGVGVAETLTGSGDEEAHTRYVAVIRKAYENARDAVKDLQERDGYRGTTIFDAVRFIVEQDLELPHLFPGLRIGLGVLAEHYQLTAVRKAA